MSAEISSGRVVWIVDDSVTDAERVHALLGTEYLTERMSDGAHALERLSAGMIPDLLILDWIMPGMSGLEVCQYVRANPKLPRIPILLLTAQHGGPEVVQAFRAGANDYVSKPFVDEELRARVKTLVDSGRLRERAEKAEANLSMLLATAPDPMFSINEGGQISYVNEEASRILQMPARAILGRHLGELVPGIGKILGSCAAPSEGESPLPDVIIHQRVFSPSVRLLPSRNSASVTITLRDVTLRRNAEARRLDFYSVIAHDLRTPITSMLIRIELICRGRHGLLPAGLIADLRQSETNLRALATMINDFLELAKLESVDYKVDRARVEIGEIIKSTVVDLQPLFEKQELKYVAHGLDEKFAVLGDGQRLLQVMSNLIGNAIKYSPVGATITTSVAAVDDQIEVVVTDTGRGIAKADIPLVFDRFTRASEVRGSTIGTGLGLMIVREIVAAHGGVVNVDSEPGVGSRFSFRLPRFPSAMRTLDAEL